MDNREQLKKGLKEITIPFMYEANLKEFLENPLATELDFIRYIRKKQKEHLETLEDIINPYFYAPHEHPITDEEAGKEWEKKKINDQYWFFKMYLEFLDEREQEIKNDSHNTKPSTPQQTEPEPPKKYTGRVYALSYVLDCRADEDLNKKDKKLKQDDREKLLAKRCNGFLSGNHIRQELNLISNNKNFKMNEDNIINIAGENWREILLDLSSNRDKLETYLKNERF